MMECDALLTSLTELFSAGPAESTKHNCDESSQEVTAIGSILPSLTLLFLRPLSVCNDSEETGKCRVNGGSTACLSRVRVTCLLSLEKEKNDAIFSKDCEYPFHSSTTTAIIKTYHRVPCFSQWRWYYRHSLDGKGREGLSPTVDSTRLSFYIGINE
jgi:hypothetical protein